MIDLGTWGPPGMLGSGVACAHPHFAGRSGGEVDVILGYVHFSTFGPSDRDRNYALAPLGHALRAQGSRPPGLPFDREFTAFGGIPHSATVVAPFELNSLLTTLGFA